MQDLSWVEIDDVCVFGKLELFIYLFFWSDDWIVRIIGFIYFILFSAASCTSLSMPYLFLGDS